MIWIVLKISGLLLTGLLLALAALLGWWAVRPNRARVDRQVVVESWDIANDGQHNSNTDLIRWQGLLYVAYVSSPYHFSSKASDLHIRRSSDGGRSWSEVESFNLAGDDIRDPKLAVIGQRLFVYALKNRSFNPEPYATVYAFTEDGRTWTKFAPLDGLDGWLFWRPKSLDGRTFYNSAYWFEHNRAALLKSSDGIHWELVSIINQGERTDETEIIFLPDGRLLATARLEYDESALEGALGDPRGATLITVSEPPYETWHAQVQSRVTRLDGPYLFSYHGRSFALGRYQPEADRSGPLTAQGSCLARKRTALFEVRLDGLAYLTDLPSSGDTSYVGLALDGDQAYATYYTSSPDHDYAWILGMFAPTAVRMARIDLKAAEALADQTPAR